MRRRSQRRFGACLAALAVCCAGAGLAWIAPGCDRDAGRKAIVLTKTQPGDPAASHAVVPRPAGQDPTTRAAATQSAQVAQAKKHSYINVRPADSREGEWVEFPEARLTVQSENGRVVAVLTSNDPPEALRPSYRGNRYYFVLQLDGADDPAHLSGAEYHYRAPTQEPQDTPNGIFLDGDKVHLQPAEMLVTLETNPKTGRVVAEIQGLFLQFPKGQVLPQQFAVYATLGAMPETKGK